MVFSPNARVSGKGNTAVMQMTVSKQEDGVTLLKLSGRMDIDGTGEIDLKLTTAAAEDGVLMITDLSGVGFMSTIGIGTLIRVAKAVRRRGGNIVILNPRPVVRLVLEKTRINEIIAMVDDYTAAVLAVKAPPLQGG
jgi:anti-anti-sigma factor